VINQLRNLHRAIVNRVGRRGERSAASVEMNDETRGGNRASDMAGNVALVQRLEGRTMLSAAPVFRLTRLVSDGSVPADFTDTNLKNPWGISFNSAANVVWIADNDTGVSSVYNPDGSAAQTGFYSTIVIPSATGSGTGSPTGQVTNTSSGFVVSSGGQSGAADYIWATEDGTIAAWNPNVNPLDATTMVNDSASNAKFFGLAQESVHGTQYLYTADLHNDKIDVFNSSFGVVKFKNGFSDSKIPTGYAPWNVQAIGDEVVVTYAKQNSGGTFATTGKGFGYVDIFSPKGVLMDRLASNGNLNAPWGVAQAPAAFGSLAGDLLVGNFGDGRVLAYNPTTNKYAGALVNTHDESIKLPGLWGLTFGDDAATADTLFFTQGPTKTTGVFGTLTLSHLVKSVTSSPAPSPTPPTTPVY
jgi:uncharacterized protein (TIGR03118 family)